MLVTTEYNLRDFDAGTSNELYRILTPYTAVDSARIDSIARQIRQAPGAADRLWTKATESQRSENDIVHAEAQEHYDRIRP